MKGQYKTCSQALTVGVTFRVFRKVSVAQAHKPAQHLLSLQDAAFRHLQPVAGGHMTVAQHFQQ